MGLHFKTIKMLAMRRESDSFYNSNTNNNNNIPNNNINSNSSLIDNGEAPGASLITTSYLPHHHLSHQFTSTTAGYNVYQGSGRYFHFSNY
jgi:hypothetical protein